MADLEEKVHNTADAVETGLDGVDYLCSKHPKKIILAIFIFLIWGSWQIRHEFLDYAERVQEIRYQNHSLEDDFYYLVDGDDTIGDVLNNDTLYYD